MQRIRARFKKQRLSLNSFDQSGWRLMLLQHDIVMVGKGVDISESGAPCEQISNGKFVSSLDSLDEVTCLVIQGDRA